MASDSNRMEDSSVVELNPPPEKPRKVPPPTPVPKRPADSAKRGAWVDYLTKVGIDRDFLEGKTRHYDERTHEVEDSTALTKNDLIALADRLGG